MRHAGRPLTTMMATPAVAQAFNRTRAGILVNTLGGGNALVPAIYDGLTPSSLTVVSNALTVWNDARGAMGFAPPVKPIGGAVNAAYNASTGGVTFNGTTNLMTTNGNSSGAALFSLDQPLTWVFVLSSSAAATSAIHTIGQQSLGQYMILEATTGPIFALKTNPSGITTASTVAPGSNIRIIALSWGGGTANIDIPNKARASAAHANSSAQTNVMLTLGGFASTAQGSSVTYAAILIKRVVTPADLVAVAAFASPYSPVAA